MEARGRGEACGGLRRSFFWPAVEARRRGDDVGFLWRKGYPATGVVIINISDLRALSLSWPAKGARERMTKIVRRLRFGGGAEGF
jgi:hypothetical protein